MTMTKPTPELKQAMADVALPVLVERLGGDVTISVEEYEAFGRKYGGHRRIGLKAEYVDDTLHLSLVTRPDALPEGPTS